MSVLKVGDTILSMSLDGGGHLTHSSDVSFVSKLYNVKTYGVNNDGRIDMAEVERLAREAHPKVIIAGASSYSRFIDYEGFARVAQEVGAKLIVDMAHVAGLVAGGVHPTPFEYADIITTTTHKTLRGPRGGLIFCKPHLAKKIDNAVFPRCQGGALQNVVAAKAICAEEAQTPEFKKYALNTVINAKAMAQEFMNLGHKIISGGTDNHMFLLDLRELGVSGAQVQQACDDRGITLNKNMVFNDTRSPKETSGVRIGTAAMTTKGWTAPDFCNCARVIAEIIDKIN